MFLDYSCVRSIGALILASIYVSIRKAVVFDADVVFRGSNNCVFFIFIMSGLRTKRSPGKNCVDRGCDGGGGSNKAVVVKYNLGWMRRVQFSVWGPIDTLMAWGS